MTLTHSYQIKPFGNPLLTVTPWREQCLLHHSLPQTKIHMTQVPLVLISVSFLYVSFRIETWIEIEIHEILLLFSDRYPNIKLKEKTFISRNYVTYHRGYKIKKCIFLLQHNNSISTFSNDFSFWNEHFVSWYKQKHKYCQRHHNQQFCSHFLRIMSAELCWVVSYFRK